MEGNPFSKYHKKLEKLYKTSGVLETALELVEPNSKRYQKLNQELMEVNASADAYIEEIYASAVFAYYIRVQPELVDSRGKIVFWSDVFGNDFEQLSKNQCHALVGLAEGYGQYKVK